MAWRRKSRPTFDQVRANYHKDIERCYADNHLPLALCTVDHVSGFNIRDQASGQRIDSDDFTARGVVREFGDQRHLRCSMFFVDRSRNTSEGALGCFYLTRVRAQNFEPNVKIEEAELALSVWIVDPTSRYRMALLNTLRDGAISGSKFIYIELGCDQPSQESYDAAIAQMRQQGYGPLRPVVEIRMWSRLELRNAPAWALRQPPATDRLSPSLE